MDLSDQVNFVEGTGDTASATTREVSFADNLNIVKASLVQGKPVALYFWDGFQSGPYIHAVLAVGFEYNESGQLIILINDPNGGTLKYYNTVTEKRFHQAFTYSGSVNQDNIDIKYNFQDTEYVNLITYAPSGQTARLYETTRSAAGTIYSRYLSNGSWSSWQSGGSTHHDIASVIFNGKLYQFATGSSNGSVSMRTNNGSGWSSWSGVSNGSTADDIDAVVFNNRIILTVRGKDSSHVFTNYSSQPSSPSDPITWSGWNLSSGAIRGTISSTIHAGYLYQAAVGESYQIFLRRSTNGINWGSWFSIGGNTKNNVNIASYNSRLHISVRGDSDQILTKKSTNTYPVSNSDFESTWTQHGEVRGEGSLYAANGKLYLAVVGITDAKVFTKEYNGTTWSSWFGASGSYAGSASTDVAMVWFEGNLYQAIKGLDSPNYVFTRTATPTLSLWGSSQAY